MIFCCHLYENSSDSSGAWTAFFTCLLFLATAALVYVASKELKHIRNGIENYSFNSFIIQESEFLRKHEALRLLNSELLTIPKNTLEGYQSYISRLPEFNRLKNDYIINLNRIAYCIIKGFLPEEDARPVYFDIFSAASGIYRQEILNGNNPFNSIIRLQTNWGIEHNTE